MQHAGCQTAATKKSSVCITVVAGCCGDSGGFSESLFKACSGAGEWALPSNPRHKWSGAASNAVQHIKVFKSWWSPKREIKDHRNYLKRPLKYSTVYRQYWLRLKADKGHNSSLCLQDSRMPVRANIVVGRCWEWVCSRNRQLDWMPADVCNSCTCTSAQDLLGRHGSNVAQPGWAVPASTEISGGLSFPASTEMWWGDFIVLLVESVGTFQAMVFGVFALFLAWNICLYKQIHQCQFETYCSKPKSVQIWHYFATRN